MCVSIVNDQWLQPQVEQRWRALMDLPLSLKTVMGATAWNNDGKKLQWRWWARVLLVCPLMTLQQWGLATYTERQQQQWEATGTLLKLWQWEYRERWLSRNGSNTSDWYTRRYIWECPSCPCIQPSLLLSTWCAGSVCSVYMWQMMCVSASACQLSSCVVAIQSEIHA